MEGEIMIPGQPNRDMTTTNDILLNILGKLEEMMQEERVDEHDICQLSYPRDGTKATLAAGTTDIDFEAGTIISTTGAVSRMSSSLRKKGKAFMQSVAMKGNKDFVAQFDEHDKFPVDASEWWQATNMEFSRLRITSVADTAFFVSASSAA